jgi:hypothetical protein
MSIWNLVGKIPGAVGSIINARVVQRVAIKLDIRLSALLSTFTSGVKLNQGTTKLRIKNQVGIGLFARVKAGLVQTTQTTAISLQNVISKNAEVQIPAVKITEYRYLLRSVKPANQASQSPRNGRSDWTDITNAEGASDGVNANFAGSALGARSGILVLEYPDYLAKTELTLTNVYLDFDFEIAGALLSNAEVILRLVIAGAGSTTMATFVDNFNGVQTINISGFVGQNWSRLDNLSVEIIASSGIAELWTVACDSVTLRLFAEKTETA